MIEHSDYLDVTNLDYLVILGKMYKCKIREL